MSDIDAVLDEFLDAHLEELIAFRRHLHAHPERSYEEHETTALIAQRLAVAGLQPRPLPIGTGLVCDVPAANGAGPRVALRADIDALSMPDEKDVAYRSQHDGIAHACGHDVHTTIVLGCGLALARVLGAGDGDRSGIRLVFQPAEETVPGGALDVIAGGGLDDVESIFALHCDPKLDVGQFGVRAGPITAAADLVEVRLHGPGGHTARPSLTVDLVSIAGQVAADLPARLRERDAALSLVFGSLHTGDAPNVIPSLAVLRGSVRTPDRSSWAGAADHLESELAGLIDGRAGHELVYTQGPPPVENDDAATDVLARGARQALGDAAVVEAAMSTGGDDFAWYLERIPGSYGRLGVRDPAERDEPIDLHASTFDVDERAIAHGIRVLARTALLALDRTA